MCQSVKMSENEPTNTSKNVDRSQATFPCTAKSVAKGACTGIICRLNCLL